MTPTHRSYSQVSQLRRCGWAYYLERVERVPSRPSVPAVAGVAVHVATELVDRELDTPREIVIARALSEANDALEQAVDKHGAQGWAPDTWTKFGRSTQEKPNGEDLEWFRTVGIPNSINAYYDWRTSLPASMTLAEVPEFGPAIELPFNYYLNGQLIYGFIDRVFTDGTNYYPLDIKSGQKPKTTEQLGLYAAALNSALDWDIQYGYYVHGLKTGKAKLTPPLSLSGWTDRQLARIYLPATRLIDEQVFIPNPGEACRTCSVADSCDYAMAVA